MTSALSVLGLDRQLEEEVLLFIAPLGQIARFDFTWGSPAYHQETLDVLRAAMKRTGVVCAVCMEPAGREIIVLNRSEP